jgi:hypothetical protein
MNGWRARYDYRLETDSFYLILRNDNFRGRRAVFSITELETTDQGLLCSDIPETNRDMLQTAFDELWSNGFRPTGYVGTEQVAAMKNHLADMRTIVFSKLGIKSD